MKTILVAEDRAASRELICAILQGAGYSVAEAADGREAINVALQARPDLMVLDLQMPLVDGFGVLDELRKEHGFAATPFIALTASAMQGDRDRALKAGFDEYITKPVSVVLLRETIARLLSR
jgi:CheY-like chemotaxis protein